MTSAPAAASSPTAWWAADVSVTMASTADSGATVANATRPSFEPSGGRTDRLAAAIAARLTRAPSELYR
jgi:hypothetical protein